MKNSKRNQLDYLLIILLTALLVVMNSCSEDDIIKDIEDPDSVGQNDPDSDPDPIPNPTDTENPDPDRVSESLSFKNGIKHDGQMPTSSNIADILVDREKIVLVEGVEPGIFLRKPSGMVLQTMYSYVLGSSSYQEFEVDIEAENDTIVYFNFEFDSSDWELPVSFDLALAPIDNNGTIVDAFVIPVIAVATTDYSNGCSNPFEDGPLHFFARYERDLNAKSLNNKSLIYNGEVVTTPVTLTGCCGPNGSYYHGCDASGAQARTIDAAHKSWLPEVETLSFYPDGTVTGYLLNKGSINRDQINSDYCNSVPAYLPESSVDNVYSGTYTFNSIDCTITINSLTGQVEPIYSEFSGEYIGDWPKYIGATFGSNTTYKVEDFVLNYPDIPLFAIDKNEYLWEHINDPETGQPQRLRCWLNKANSSNIWFTLRKHEDGVPSL